MEEKPSDDEKPNYITELNTFRAKQENPFKGTVHSKLIINYRNKAANYLRYLVLFNTVLINLNNLSTTFLSGGAL